ncbi:MAG: tetratricopeptide repeat protein [Treponema sp.]|jgi:tetratricopeptide (TPR) repeat protein|nr:tetratricopeptide repeat protein [Treponema sp.]
MTVIEYTEKWWDLIRKKDYNGALELCYTALAEHPDDYTMLGHRASAWIRKGENEKALLDCTRMIELDPRNPSGWDSRGGLYHKLGRYDEAIADYTRMTELMPRDPDGWNNRGNLYHELGRYDEAIADYTQCIPLSPRNYGTYWSNRGISYYEKGDLDKAIEDFTSSIETWNTEDCTCWALYNRGLAWKKKGDLKKALADFRKSAAREYDKKLGYDALFQAGYVWFLRGEPEKAIGYFSRAIKRRDDCADYWLARGVCYWNQCVKHKTGFWDENGDIMDMAIDDFTKAIELAPDMADAWFDRGIVRCAKAQESHNLIKAIFTQKAADNAERALLMAQLTHIGGKDLVPQADAMLRGLRSNRDEVEVLMAKSFGLFAEDDAREAIADLTRAIELGTDHADAWYQRGLAFALLGEKDKALADYEQTRVVDPFHSRAAAKRDELLQG